jgi:DNA invertase Pin-like site-specific DNA recombinase/DNA-binding winged helix-turn-helix (wHTH) protein
MAAIPQIPAAQYLRMSTGDQQTSIPVQRDAIQRYATAHGFEIVATYSDVGKSGLYIRNRPGLRHLLRKVLSGECRFRAILVFDVSRWGRFQDTDESAHYEFLCRRAGIPVHYCAEQFDNDGRLPNAILKSLKRAMAAEYSRELTVKISSGQKRLAAQGYHVGGAAGYGLRRMLVSANDRRRQVLQEGERKNLKSDHTVLIPGPKREADCVRTIFALAANKKNSPRSIAEELNRRKLPYRGTQRWDYIRVYRILKSEKYIGSNVWGRNQCPFRNRPQRVPRSAWIIKPGAFPAVISSEQFVRAQKQISRRRCNPGKPDNYYLDRLARFLLRKGEMPAGMLKKRRRITASMCTRHFGGVFPAYELIGYKPTSHVVNSHEAALKMRSLKADLFNQLKKLFPSKLRMVHYSGEKRFRTLELDGHVRIAVHICRIARSTASGEPRWMLRMRPRDGRLPALICMPDSGLSRLTAFYFLTDLGQVETKWKIVGEAHPWLASTKRLQSLSDLYRVATHVVEGQPQKQHQDVSIVGDVVFREDSPTMLIDGNEIQLSRANAAIFRLLLRNEGRVVPRRVLSVSRTKDKEVYLNIQIHQLRKALGTRFRDRIATFRNQGYMYQKVSAIPSI